MRQIQNLFCLASAFAFLIAGCGQNLDSPRDRAGQADIGDASVSELQSRLESGDLNAYLAGLPDEELSQLTLDKLIAFNEERADEEMPWFSQEIFEKSLAKGPLTENAYRDALTLAQRATREDGIDAMMAEHDLDALVAPTGAPAWKIDRINGDHFIGGSSTYAAVSGYPNITLPMGDVHGMPVGLSIFGLRLSEPVLIEIAYGYEHTAARP